MKKIVIIAAAIILAISAWTFYLNEKILPVKIKSRVISDLEGVTKKKVLIGSVKFNIFKGLIFRDIIIRDEEKAVINVKEASCSVFILPLLKKQVVVPRLTLESPEIFIERRSDNSFNIMELFSGYHEKKKDFSFMLRRIVIKKGGVNFHDLTLDPVFKKELKDMDADIYLDIPAKVRFAVKLNIQSDAPAALDMKGEYLLPGKEFNADIRLSAILPKDFEQYYKKGGFYFPEGQIDFAIGLKHRKGVLKASIDADAKALAFSKEALSAKFDAKILAELHYGFSDNKFSYSGTADILDGRVSGIDTIKNIDDIKGKVEFSNLGLSSGNTHATILGLPMEAKLRIDDFSNPILNIDTVSSVTLETFQHTLKNAFGIEVPADLKGPGKLGLAIRYKLSSPTEFQIKGTLSVSGASISANHGKDLLEKVTGIFQFTPSRLNWEESAFRYKDIDYRTSGELTNFKTPGVQLKLYSEDLALDAVFAINGRLFNFSRFSGRYFNSTFSMNGSIDASDQGGTGALYADMSGIINLDPEDLKESLLKKFKEKFEKIKPKGDVRAELSIKGNIKDLKTCAIDAKLSSDNLSLYDLKMQNTTLNYSQKNGVGDILFMRSFLYGGSMGLTAKIGWASQGVPYAVDANVEGVKIEKLKTDAAFKDKDISGSMNIQVRLDGVAGDIARLKGQGRAVVSNGKLWQLNLFRGLGMFLFTSDFSSIIFKECSADFGVRDKTIFSDEVNLKSDLLDIYGPVKIGFDGAVSGMVKVEFSANAITDSRLKTSVAAGIENYTMVALGGTVKDPKYNIRLDAANIVQSVVENLMNR